MRISTGLLLGAALSLGSAAIGGCDDKDSDKKTEKHETHAETPATTGPGWVSVSNQHASVWHFVRQPAPIAGGRLVSEGASPGVALPPASADDPLAGIQAAIGANMLPTRDSVRATDLVNRALRSADPPGEAQPPSQVAAVLVTTPWNDDTLLLWIAVPGAIMTDATAVSIEFDPKTVATFRPLGDAASVPVPDPAAGGTPRSAMLYELSPMTDSEPAKPGAAAPALQLGVLHVTGTAGGGTRIDRPITVGDLAGGIDNVPDAVQYAVAVAGFGGLLRGDPAFHDLSCADTIALVESAAVPDPDGWRAALIRLMHRAEPLIDLPSREAAPAEDSQK